MAKDKKPRERYNTPVGVALFPHLSTPVRWDESVQKTVADLENGNFTLDLRLTPEQAAPVIAHLEALRQAWVLEVQKDRPNIPVSQDKPFATLVDDSGVSFVRLRFKLRAQFKNKQTGIVRKNVPNVFDTRGVRLEAEVWGGSTVEVAYSPYRWASGKGAGLSLNLDGVMVHNLVTRGQQSAADLGFNVQSGAGDDAGREEGSSDAPPPSDIPF